MSTICPSISETAFLKSVLDLIDCQAGTLGAFGFQALAAPGSLVPLLLSALLTIFIALFGMKMLLGHTPDLPDLSVAALKVGIVLTLAFSWSAYRILIYDVALLAPAELAGRLTASANPGNDLPGRLQLVDDAFLELGRLGTGPRHAASATAIDAATGVAAVQMQAAHEPPHVFEPFALGTARLAFLTGSIAGAGSVRLVAGLLLALGPLFILSLLFSGTRSLLEGWLRGLIAAALGGFAVTVILSLQLDVMTPWMFELLALRRAGLPIGGAPTELLVLTMAFVLILVAAVGASARVGVAFRFGPAWRTSDGRSYGQREREGATPRDAAGPTSLTRSAEPSRAAALSEALVLAERREIIGAAHLKGQSRGASGGAANEMAAPHSPSRQSTRRIRGRVSASATRRDSKL